MKGNREITQVLSRVLKKTKRALLPALLHAGGNQDGRQAERP